MVPTLTTDRLALRGWREDDARAVRGDHRRPRGHALHGRHARPGADAGGRSRCTSRHFALRGYGLWAVERDGELIGRVGLWRPEGWPGLEVGWLLGRPAWGHGYATEAGRAAVEFAWSELGAEQVISLIAPDNVASQRVAERLGMRRLRDYSLRGERHLTYGLDRAE